ncbi:hypothetical protein DFH09DRAFT_1025124 [Mycena vulgaris]|nr:hypothetical protein DFH09DRAFT_1025124 [Mycena vulgaris]
MSEDDSLHKVEGLWFSTDFVILQAGTHIFQVPAATSKAQSSVFSDMFLIPQPPSADTESMDEYPVVKLHDDAYELEVFLKVIFDSRKLCNSLGTVTSLFADIIGILRLSHKYDVPYLRRCTLQHLSIVYPTSLFDYDARADNDKVGGLWLLAVAYHDVWKRHLSMIITAPEWTNELGEAQRTACLLGPSAQI